jgi:UDP-N-acetylglucosamine 4-epimerase
MSKLEEVLDALRVRAARWLVTGGAGFIGSHLVEQLLAAGQEVTVLDNFATGHRANLDAVLASTPPAHRDRLRVIEGDIRDRDACLRACDGAEYVLHQAALGSVPRSLQDPVTSHDVNVNGFVQMLLAARDRGVRRFVYASSSSVYGDHPALPKSEPQIGRPLSPYAATKYVNEVYAGTFGRSYGIETIGLRYFNVFGPRQDPNGPYAAVMPIWFATLLSGERVRIHGDGETSRDFCFVLNAVQANLLAATARQAEAVGEIFNIACGDRITLNQLFGLIRAEVARLRPSVRFAEVAHGPFRPGDVRHSLADISKAQCLLGYEPTHRVADGLRGTAAWYEALARAAKGFVSRP